MKKHEVVHEKGQNTLLFYGGIGCRDHKPRSCTQLEQLQTTTFKFWEAHTSRSGVPLMFTCISTSTKGKQWPHLVPLWCGGWQRKPSFRQYGPLLRLEGLLSLCCLKKKLLETKSVSGGPHYQSVRLLHCSAWTSTDAVCVCVNTCVHSRGLCGCKALQVVLPDGCVPLLVGGLQSLSMAGSRS